MGFILKRATVEDAELLATMRLEMRRERETAKCRISEEDFFRANLEFFREQIGSGNFVSFIAWDGDKAAACSGLTFQIHPPTYSNPSGKSGYLSNLYTRPEWRHMGLARLLLDKQAEVAKAAGCAQLFMNASPMGRHIYVKYGYRPVEGEMTIDL